MPVASRSVVTYPQFATVGVINFLREIESRAQTKDFSVSHDLGQATGTEPER